MNDNQKALLGLVIWLPVYYAYRSVTWPIRKVKQLVKGKPEKDEERDE